MLPSVIAICATSGRHTLLERSVRMFLEQDYEGLHKLLIFNNSKVPQILHLPGELPLHKRVILINSCEKNYQNLGEIYNDTLEFMNTDLVTFWDDDDLFLKNHISEGAKGYIKATLRSERPYRAYKPEKSYYRSINGIELVANTLEPSIFTETDVIRACGFKKTTSDQHMSWVSYLQLTNTLFTDPEGVPTLIYNWGDRDIPTWKTSGDPLNPNNFSNYRRFSQDNGDGIVTPISKKEYQSFFKSIGFEQNI
jgi:hypothetical protein